LLSSNDTGRSRMILFKMPAAVMTMQKDEHGVYD
jgi:hypothetical protein